jgi:cytochrome c oxidase assembly factor CtaG
MVQHLLLMVVAPPLLWIGAPVAPILLGLPRRARTAVATLLAARPIRRGAAVAADPRVAWAAFVVAFWAWHVPALYALALASDVWHHVEHACFFATGLAFWHVVVSPWPARRVWSRWAVIVYLLLAEAQATVLAAILTFADRVVYPAYRTTQAAPLDDQALAGVIMWVPGSVPFAIALAWLVVRALDPQLRPAPRTAAAATTPVTARHGSIAPSAGKRSCASPPTAAPRP